MNLPHLSRASAAFLCCGVLVHAQSIPETNPPVLELPAFEVRSAQDDSYVGKEAISTTRTGVELRDLPQSVVVLNRAFLDDLNPTMQGDVLKYVGGAQTGNLNFSVDRFMLRGFTGESDYQDGFRSSQTETQADLAIVERMEIIKGPSAIFIANGPVGGVVNKISKSPTSYNVRSLRVEAGAFDSNRAELDLGGPITADKKLMYRLVAVGQNTDGWYDRTYVHRLLLAPSLAYQFSPTTRLSLKYEYVDTHFSSYNGQQLDLRTDNGQAGLNRQVQLMAVPPKTHFGEDDPLNWRTDVVRKFIGEFTTRPSDLLAVRLAALWSDTSANRHESTLAAIPATYAGGPLNRGTTAIYNKWPRRTLQNDYVFTFKTGGLGHKLLTGLEVTDNTTQSTTFTGTSSAIDPFNPVFPGTVTVNLGTPSSRTKTLNEFGKIFALETLSALDDRILLSVGGSRNVVRTQATNLLTNTANGPLVRIYQSLFQWGLVVKPVKNISLFYGYNENFSPNVQNNQVLPSQQGKQHEFGVKAELLDGKLTANAAYFDIKQVNLTAPSFPQTTPPTFVLISGENSKGFDGDISWSVTDQIDLMFAFASFNAEVPNTPTAIAGGGIPVLPAGNVSENTFGLWTRYKFTTDTLKGLTVAVGINQQSKKAITDSANTTFYGWVPGRTLVDVSLSYQHGKFRYSLNVDNALDKEYIYAARNQALIIPGTGRNFKGSVTWKF